MWNDRHNVIYVPELKGLLDARNWILKQSNDWVLMTDDDVLEIKDINNDKEISWDKFIIETENIISQTNDEIGVIGFNFIGNKNYSKQYQIGNNFDLYGAVVLNAPLLKSKGFKYEGFPFDGVNGQKAHCEDTDLLYYCYANNIKTLRINCLYINFNKKHQSIAWGNFKNREKMLVLSYIWLLGKYKDYPKITEISKSVIDSIINNLKYNNQLELFDDIVNEVSCETLNKFTGEEEMKKMLIGGLVVCLMMGLFVGCPEKPEEEKNDGIETVDPQYQGRYNVTNQYYTNVHYVISKNKFDQYNNDNDSSPSYSFTARTGNNDLYIMANTDKNVWSTPGNMTEVKIGYFQNNNLILNNFQGGVTSTNTRTAEKVQE